LLNSRKGFHLVTDTVFASSQKPILSDSDKSILQSEKSMKTLNERSPDYAQVSSQKMKWGGVPAISTLATLSIQREKERFGRDLLPVRNGGRAQNASRRMVQTATTSAVAFEPGDPLPRLWQHALKARAHVL
jgi:hypothetical protein